MTFFKLSTRFLLLFFLAYNLAACSTFNAIFPTSGPSRSQIMENPSAASNEAEPKIEIIDVTPLTAQNVLKAQKQNQFSDFFPSVKLNQNLVGSGDILEVNIWEADPPILFGASSNASIAIQNSSTSKATTLPPQVVTLDGTINIPFVGYIKVAGKNTEAIGNQITQALRGKANFPQVLVRLTSNVTSNITVVGNVNNSMLIPISPKQEKLLDAIAMAGGVKDPINKVTIQLARNGKTLTMPLETIIKSPKDNIILAPGDVITSYFQPFSFTALGATSQNQEVTFEAQGISLVQALARVGGVQDTRADSKGVFIFRFEDPSVVSEKQVASTQIINGKIPVVYRVDLSDGGVFLTAQNFPIKDKDVLYVSNASSVELQKFLNILVSAIYPVVNAGAIPKGY
ncbi:polysaccharide biosynthesis/export family protein [Polynucleobacter sphagniphilus]|uniref:polysaccharide biosynthesis/export family protein n=1 Tax=Polynucleobacter sphagniphilus TaxID=1743169 RepID=UPI002476089A|nr:polysaccharide biosynthesis/export family protein [Polynucleobacter sphagniphilus]MDH6299948.1 polysaccharide export outer membrane protein [Polynucleobacter sphagniphilus]